MKAIRVHASGGPDVLKIEEIADPHAGSGQVVVRVHAVGVNPVETYIREGKQGYAPKSFPYKPGADGAGIVESIGEGVTRVKVGDRVYMAGTISGSYAEKTLCDEKRVHRLAEKVSFAQGAAVGVPYATAYRALHIRAQAKPGETVLIHGATGGVGIAAVQIARAHGMTIFATGGTDEGRKLVAEQGAHHVFDHKLPDYLKQLMSLTQDRGVDVILEMLANVNLGKDLTILAKKGRVIVIGSRGTVEIDARNTMSREADIRGMSLPNASEEEQLSIHAAIVAGLENGTLRPIVAKQMPLADAPKAHEAVMSPGARGKIVLIP